MFQTCSVPVLALSRVVPHPGGYWVDNFSTPSERKAGPPRSFACSPTVGKEGTPETVVPRDINRKPLEGAWSSIEPVTGVSIAFFMNKFRSWWRPYRLQEGRHLRMLMCTGPF